MSRASTDPAKVAELRADEADGEGPALGSLYVCPQTQGLLTRDGEWLVAEGSGRRYPIREGVPDFRSVRAREEDPGAQKLIRLNQFAPERGWRAALQEVYGADEGMWRYITRPAPFLGLLPLSPGSLVLEIGPGLGQFTRAISERAAEVYALEVSPGQAEFVATRLRQEGGRNVQVACGGDDDRLPYVSASFDLVICNLVFEWCASRNMQETFEAGQRRFLAEVARVLKPGGSLFLATKNRFALRYLLGKPDEHADGMRFGNALPRWAMRAALRHRGKARPAGLLHSHRGLAGSLHQAGFADLASFWATPEVRFPSEYVSNRPDVIRAARRRREFWAGAGRLERLLMPLVPARLAPHLTPGLVFLARTPGSGNAP